MNFNEIETLESKASADELAEAIKMVTVELIDELTELYDMEGEDQIPLVYGFVLHKSSDDGGGCVDIIQEEDWIYAVNCSISHDEKSVDYDPCLNSKVISEAIKIANRKTFIVKQTVTYEVEFEVEGDSAEDVSNRAEYGEFDDEIITLENEPKALDTRDTCFEITEKE